jgi:hypothetical protein
MYIAGDIEACVLMTLRHGLGFFPNKFKNYADMEVFFMLNARSRVNTEMAVHVS